MCFNGQVAVARKRRVIDVSFSPIRAPFVDPHRRDLASHLRGAHQRNKASSQSARDLREAHEL